MAWLRSRRRFSSFIADHLDELQPDLLPRSQLRHAVEDSTAGHCVQEGKVAVHRYILQSYTVKFSRLARYAIFTDMKLFLTIVSIIYLFKDKIYIKISGKNWAQMTIK